MEDERKMREMKCKKETSEGDEGGRWMDRVCITLAFRLSAMQPLHFSLPSFSSSNHTAGQKKNIGCGPLRSHSWLASSVDCNL